MYVCSRRDMMAVELFRINLCISLVYFCLHYWKCTVQKTK